MDGINYDKELNKTLHYLYLKFISESDIHINKDLFLASCFHLSKACEFFFTCFTMKQNMHVSSDVLDCTAGFSSEPKISILGKAFITSPSLD